MEKPAVTKTPQEQSLNASQTNSPLSTNLKHKRTVSIVHHENDVESQGKNLENGISKPIVLATSEDNLEHLDDAQEVELNSSLKRKSSINSQNSSINVLSYYMDKIGNLYLDWLETSIMSYLILKANNCQTKILFWMLITALPGLINIIVVLVFFNRELNSIYDSNLIQIVLGFSGHAVVLATYKLQEIIATAIIGDELVRGTATVDMVTKKQGARIPSSNAKMRFVIITSAFAYDAAVIAICVFLSWRNITTNLPGKDKDGKYPCIPAKYTQNFTVPTLFKLGDFLEGKIDVSTIQQDALPLSDGLIGGFGAWPLFLPPNGYLFAIKTRCGIPTKIDPKMFNMTNTISTFWKLGTTIALPGIYSFETFIAYPAGTHIFDPLKNDPIQIACSVDVITGKGELTTTMQVDKWNNVALGAIQKIRIPFKGDFLTVSEELNFSHIERAFSKNPNQHDHDNITQWLQIAVESVFNGTSFAPTQGGYPAANNMRWAANAGGFYDPSIAWQGVAGALAPLFKFVFNQYDGTSSGTCYFSADLGSGYADAPRFLVILVTSLTGWLFFVTVYQFLQWKIAYKSGREVDLACQTLDLPLRLIINLSHDSGSWIIDDSHVNSGTEARILNRYSSINVKFGELKSTRQNNVGVLAIVSDPKKVVPLVKGRDYK